MFRFSWRPNRDQVLCINVSGRIILLSKYSVRSDYRLALLKQLMGFVSHLFIKFVKCKCNFLNDLPQLRIGLYYFTLLSNDNES